MTQLTYAAAMSALRTAIEKELRDELARKLRDLADEAGSDAVETFRDEVLSDVAMMIESGQI